jgi:hypothetical protein
MRLSSSGTSFRTGRQCRSVEVRRHRIVRCLWIVRRVWIVWRVPILSIRKIWLQRCLLAPLLPRLLLETILAKLGLASELCHRRLLFAARGHPVVLRWGIVKRVGDEQETRVVQVGGQIGFPRPARCWVALQLELAAEVVRLLAHP